MSDQIYTGVGARNIPWADRSRLEAIGEELAELGWVLRTGGASGSDAAFLQGCSHARGRAEVFLPRPDFRGYRGQPALSQPTPEAFELACKILGPVWWSQLDPFSMCAHARNMHEVLGADLVTPSQAIVCWTPGAQDVGGTSSALRCGRMHNVPVFNIADERRFTELKTWLRQEVLL